MNHSIYSADRATHLKIVVVALIAGTMVAGIGVASRLSGSSSLGVGQMEAKIPLIKAGQPLAVSNSGVTTVR